MNVISYEFGQVLQPIWMEEVRPFSGVYLPDLYRAICERYRFVVRPTESGPALAGNAKFESGVFSQNGHSIGIGSLGIYNDGILVVCRKTDDADLIVDDLIEWATNMFKLRQPRTGMTRKHTSHLVVEFDVTIDRFVNDFNAISKMFESALEADQGVRIKTQLQRLALAADPLDGLSLGQTAFSIEPRAGVPFGDRRYFSAAPMTSAAHLRLLADMEVVLANRA